MNLAVSGGGQSTQIIYLKEEILHYKNTPLLQSFILKWKHRSVGGKM